MDPAGDGKAFAFVHPSGKDDSGLVGGGQVAIIRPIRPEEDSAAVGLLAIGMAENPLHLRVFGMEAERRLRRLRGLFELLLRHLRQNGDLLGAFDAGDRMTGVLGLIRPGLCRPALSVRLQMGATILARMPPGVVWRVRRWLITWERLEPARPHWHFGPLAVAPEQRRQGIASRLMEAGCGIVDAAGLAPAWLETDLEANARFYRRFGFAVARRQPVLGVDNWFMIREAGRSRMAGDRAATGITGSPVRGNR